jgi:ABC-2 type transport system permease protein
VNFTLIKKCFAEARLLFASLGALLFAVCWLRVFIVTRLQTSQFATIVEQFWDEFKDLWPVSLEQLLSYTGRIAVGYNEPIVVFGVCIFAIARGSDVVSGELGRGTLEMLLAQPVSRLQVLCTQAAVTLVGLAALCGLTWAGTAAGIHTMTVKEDLPPPSISIPGLKLRIPLSLKKPEKIRVPMSEKTKASYFMAGAFNLFCLGAALAGFSSFLSSLDRYRWRTIGIVVAAFAISLLLKLLGQAISEVAWLQYLSIFTAYEPQKFISMAVHRPEMVWSVAWFDSVDARRPLAELGALGYNLILLSIALVFYIAAGIVFHRRDLPAPL